MTGENALSKSSTIKVTLPPNVLSKHELKMLIKLNVMIRYTVEACLEVGGVVVVYKIVTIMDQQPQMLKMNQ